MQNRNLFSHLIQPSGLYQSPLTPVRFPCWLASSPTPSVPTCSLPSLGPSHSPTCLHIRYLLLYLLSF